MVRIWSTSSGGSLCVFVTDVCSAMGWLSESSDDVCLLTKDGLELLIVSSIIEMSKICLYEVNFR
jgi:hypothetical protein